MMKCVVQTMNWWCGYIDWPMVMDHVDDVLMESLLCWWKPSVNMHGHGSIHKDFSTCTLGILSLKRSPMGSTSPKNRRLWIGMGQPWTSWIVWVSLEVQRIAWKTINGHSHLSDERCCEMKVSCIWLGWERWSWLDVIWVIWKERGEHSLVVGRKGIIWAQWIDWQGWS